MWNWISRRVSPRDASPVVKAPVTVLYARLGNLLATSESNAIGKQHIAVPVDAAVSDGKSARAIRRRKKLDRFCGRFSAMSRREARLLFAIHRRTIPKIAGESTATLHRDLQRFVLSSAGQRIWRGRPAPEVASVRRWIAEAHAAGEARSAA